MTTLLAALGLVSAAAPLTEEAVVREFATICVPHFRDLAGVKRAAAASSRRYALRDNGNVYSERTWTSPGLSIDYYEGGVMSSRATPQCILTADLPRPVDAGRLYTAVAALPGATKVTVGTSRWFGGKAWELPGMKTAVARVDPGLPRQIRLSLQPYWQFKGTK